MTLQFNGWEYILAWFVGCVSVTLYVMRVLEWKRSLKCLSLSIGAGLLWPLLCVPFVLAIVDLMVLNMQKIERKTLTDYYAQILQRIHDKLKSEPKLRTVR